MITNEQAVVDLDFSLAEVDVWKEGKTHEKGGMMFICFLLEGFISGVSCFLRAVLLLREFNHCFFFHLSSLSA